MIQKIYTIAGITAATMIYFACGTASKTTSSNNSFPIPGEAEFTIAQQKFPGTTMNQLKAGHMIYTTKCNKCHDLKSIGNRSESEWTGAIESMSPKANLNANEKADLTTYIMSTRAVLNK